MPTLEQVEQRRADLVDLHTLALTDATYLVQELANEDPRVVQDTLRRYLPDLVDPYAAAAGEQSAAAYMADRAAAGVSRAYPAAVASTLPEIERYRALAGWASSVLFANPELTAAVISRLASGLSRIVFNAHADTTADLAAADSVGVRYQRMAAVGCCDFCGIMASRGAVYSSESAALRVVGRGVPVPDVPRRRGGAPGGVKARGARALGDTFHDNCKCTAVALFEGREQQMESVSREWFDVYQEARDRSREALPRDLVKHEYLFKSDPSKIHSRMRNESPVGEAVPNAIVLNEITRQMRLIRAGAAETGA